MNTYVVTNEHGKFVKGTDIAVRIISFTIINQTRTIMRRISQKITNSTGNIHCRETISTFRKINNKLKLGKVGYSTKFRCHQLRAFQASTLVNLEDNPFTIDEVDALQGRKKDRTHRAYFTESKSKLFKKYYDNVDSLMFFKSIHGVDEETFEKVIAENSVYKKEIVKNEQKLEAQEKTINQIISNQKELEALLGL